MTHINCFIHGQQANSFISYTDGRAVPASNCVDDLHFGGGVAGAEAYGAGNLTTDATVLPTGRLHLKAGRDIYLEPDSEVQKGGYLQAEQVVCYLPVEEWRFEYCLADHLGNNRVLFLDLDGEGRIDLVGEVLQKQHYYAFGLEMEGAWNDRQPDQEQRYRFNEMERNDELGLDLAPFRSYDPAIGRWLQVDPKAESFATMSPYTGMGNKPISVIDPMGDSIRLHFVSQLPSIDRSMLTMMVNHDLEGQFEASISDDGILSIVATQGGGDISKLSENGQAFYEEMNRVTTADGVADIKIDRQNSDVPTGRYDMQTIDITDVAQYNKNLSDLGGTRGGKLAHEFAEQHFAQTQKSDNVPFEAAHPHGITAENTVNRSYREDTPWYQVFWRNGQQVRTHIGTGKPVISVRNEAVKEK